MIDECGESLVIRVQGLRVQVECVGSFEFFVIFCGEGDGIGLRDWREEEPVIAGLMNVEGVWVIRG